MIGFCVYAIVAVMWFIPDKRFEKRVQLEENLNVHQQL
jgi:hypothetical protein